MVDTSLEDAAETFGFRVCPIKPAATTESNDNASIRLAASCHPTRKA
jgi:hypothetical protein